MGERGSLAAGRELDYEIARCIFLWSVECVDAHGPYVWAVNTRDDWHWMAAKTEAAAWEYAPHFSTDPGDAFRLVEYLRKKGCDVALCIHAATGTKCVVNIGEGRTVAGNAPTPAHAICLATLLWSIESDAEKCSTCAP